MKKTFMLGFSLLTGLLAGCENPTEINDGIPDPIPVNGFAWEGLLANAKVRFVGLDQYGQPQRNGEGGYVGQIHYTNEEGALVGAEINGSYTGPLLVIASYDKYTRGSGEEAVEKETSLRCPLPDGCIDESGATIEFNEAFTPSEEFEMMAVVHAVSDPLTVHISPMTHLAAKLAFGDFIGDGTGCDDANCLGDTFAKGLITPEKIYEANSRVQQQAQLTTGFPVSLAPWQNDLGLDSVIQLDSAKHALLSFTFFEDMKSRAETVSATLDRWLSDYLLNKGQLIEDDQTNDPKQIDFKTLFDTSVLVEQQYANTLGGSQSDESLEQAANAFANLSNGLVANQVSAFVGDVLPVGEGEDTLETKIQDAKALVGDVRDWLTDLGNHDYVSFFSQEIHDDILAMEANWEAYNNKLSPVLQELFLPLVQFVEYNLTCVRGAGNVCDSNNVLHTQDLDGVNGVDITYNAEDESFTYIVNANTGVFPKISFQGRFEASVGDTNNFKRFLFTGTNTIETENGRVSLESADGVFPQIAMTMGAELDAANEPDIRRMELALPFIKVTAKDDLGATMSARYEVDEMGVVLQGTVDPTIEDSPVHFNIEEIEFTGTILDSSVATLEKMVTNARAVSSKASEYYAQTRFPNLDVSIDSAALKEFARFGGVDATHSEFGGWLELPSNVVLGETLTGKVQYYEQDDYGQLDTALKEVLELNNVLTFSYGSLAYPGGETALVIWKDSADDEVQQARQCLKVGEAWGCFTELPLTSLGCGNDYGQEASTVSAAFTYLQTEGCISQVKIDGRGIYDIQYPDSVFVDGESPYDITLNKPHRLGLSSFNIRTLGFFKVPDEENSGELRDSRALFDVTGGAIDLDEISLSVSMAHEYEGFAGDDSIGLGDLSFFNFIPYGERVLWLAVGTDPDVTDALVYYIQQNNITLTMFGFDYTAEDSNDENSVDRNPDHDAPLGYLRYDGKLLGTLRQEGSLYVVRYIDGSWQVL